MLNSVVLSSNSLVLFFVTSLLIGKPIKANQFAVVNNSDHTIVQPLDLSQSELKMVRSDNIWTLQYGGTFTAEIRSYYLTFSEETTLLDGKEFFELLRSDQEDADVWVGTGNYCREDNRKVWLYQESGEQLIYDFNLEIGDPLLSTSSDTLVLSGIDTFIGVDGTQRMRQHFKCKNDVDNFYGTRTLIEGIGDLQGPLTHLYNSCFVDGQDDQLNCFEQNEVPVLGTGNCWITSTRDTEIEDLKVYPNPANEKMFVSSESIITNVEIYTTDGKLLGIESGPEIDLSTLPNGILILKINNNSGQTAFKKIMKK